MPAPSEAERILDIKYSSVSGDVMLLLLVAGRLVGVLVWIVFFVVVI